MTIFESFKKRFAISELITDFMFATEHAHTKELNHIDELENDISDIMYSKFLSTV
jgi:hypothetical protein